MTDRELLEKAAKAAGIEIVYWATPIYPVCKDGEATVGWSPIDFDSDALRLAVKLEINICFGANYVIADGVQVPTVNNANDPYAATRRAIVRAAAAIGGAT